MIRISVKVPEETTVKEMFKNIPGGRRSIWKVKREMVGRCLSLEKNL